ncbi:3-oxoacyl-[acyl-carrier-protein] reductase (NADPH) SCDLUD_004163 [Saccharomycodes ludwigii]|uniref:3-oxoacyl-[acyl-carrier-protein] reductase (NADPH) n=1 Tax=Saccharomycodes ludwigii TaxID=36035 RepID=UPI001E8A389A|nr:hypothetical protein SCDLUD_004163 [Saccharomycodes ludwigii]KAH3899864.1 hypothetical protein SCDLUD_004163 [Saccharomycodes ludwigii]
MKKRITVAIDGINNTNTITNNVNNSEMGFIYTSRNEENIHNSMNNFISLANTASKSKNNIAQFVGIVMDVNEFNPRSSYKMIFSDSLNNKKIEMLQFNQLINRLNCLNNGVHGSDISTVILSHGIAQDKLTLRINSRDYINEIMNTNFTSNVMINNYFLKKWLLDSRRSKLATASKVNKATSKKVILNISSILGGGMHTPTVINDNENNNMIDLNVPGTSIYSASKSALNKYIKVVQNELDINKKNNITISYYSPGLIKDTDMIKNLKDSEYLLKYLDSKTTAAGGDNDNKVYSLSSTSDVVANNIWKYVGELKQGSPSS